MATVVRSSGTGHPHLSKIYVGHGTDVNDAALHRSPLAPSTFGLVPRSLMHDLGKSFYGSLPERLKVYDCYMTS